MKQCITCVLLAVALYSIQSANARLLNVPADHNTIQEAIDASEEGDTVLVQPGTYDENVVFNRSGVVLGSLILTTGNPAYIDSTIIDGGGRDCVVSIEVDWQQGSATLRGFTIRNGGGQPFGGGIDCQNGHEILMEDLLVTGNSSQGMGGGIYSRTGGTLRRVIIRDNETDWRGGGIGFRGMSLLLMEDCLITGNRTQGLGGGLSNMTEGGSSNALLRRCVIAGNEATRNAAGWFYYCRLIVDNCTITDNVSQGDSLGYSSISVSSPDDYPVLFRNSIIYGNGENQLSSSGGIISFCDIEEGQDSIRGGIQWGEGNIDNDPLFVDPESGDYHLSLDSPCIDAGDPDSTHDLDGSPVEIGAFGFTGVGFVGGHLSLQRNGEGVAGATIRVDVMADEQESYEKVTDENGNWSSWIRRPFVGEIDVDVTASLAGYPDVDTTILMRQGDSVRVNLILPDPVLVVSPESIDMLIDSGAVGLAEIRLQNGEDVSLSWRASVQPIDEAGLPLWTFLDSIDVAEVTGDQNIRGVAFDGESYFAAGASENERNMIYRLSRDGALVDSFVQPGESLAGFRDLEWDGELLWGAHGNSIFAVNRDGDMVHQWRSGSPINSSIACDLSGGTVWITSVMGDILAYDQDGRYLRSYRTTPEMRVYGLAWFNADPDSCPLIILGYEGNDSGGLFKMNDRTGEILHIDAQPFGPEAIEKQGLFISCNFSPAYWTVMTIGEDEAHESDRIEVYHFRPNEQWITISPSSGEIGGNGEVEIEVEMRTVGADLEWNFALGEYLAELTLVVEGSGLTTVIPIRLEVVEPNNVAEEPAPLPTQLSLSSFPNPFNSTTNISYTLPSPGRYALSVVDITGREVARLGDGWREAGSYREVWDGAHFTSGQYVLRLNGGANELRSTPVTIIK